MRLATHNTMTYLRPKQWWAKLLPFIAKCQKVDYKKQHELGAKGFDLRLFWDKNGQLEYRHGIYRYPADNIHDVLDYASKNNILVRVLFELRTYNEHTFKNVEELRNKFVDFCKELEEKYPTVQFYCGRETGTWKQLYEFNNQPIINEVMAYSSNTSLFKTEIDWLQKIDDWCPWIYAKLTNRKSINEYKKKDDTWYVCLDFINIQ